MRQEAKLWMENAEYDLDCAFLKKVQAQEAIFFSSRACGDNLLERCGFDRDL